MDFDSKILESKIEEVYQAIKNADGMVVITGAGMGVDSGLGTFRGTTAVKYTNELGLGYEDLCSPDAYKKYPELTNSFWSEMITAFNKAQPHEGYSILKEIGSKLPHGLFSFTTNIDGFWEGFVPEDRLVEIHGSTKYLQCSIQEKGKCFEDVWRRDEIKTENEPIPCIHCGKRSRPAVMMFNDWMFNERVVNQQKANYGAWLAKMKNKKLVILEIGCGGTVETVRATSSSLARKFNTRVYRVNPDKSDENKSYVTLIKMGALAFLIALKARFTVCHE
jgi:NAD-dependent SIR2 family protein deacetylase